MRNPLRLALGIFLLIQLAADASAQTYHVTDLGALLGTNSYAHGINHQSQVVGYWQTTNGMHAFLYTNGVMTDLGALGGTNAYALSINNPGQIVGFADATNGVRAFLFENGAMTSLGSLGGLNSYAFGINASAQIVGYVDTSDGTRAFIYSGGGATNLGTLGGTNSHAFGINIGAQVAGSSLVNDNVSTHAFLWQNGSMTNLNDLVPTNSGWELQEARGINDGGRIVGWGITNGEERAFIYNSGGITELGLLASGTNSYALGLNNSNHVVGASSTSNGLSSFGETQPCTI